MKKCSNGLFIYGVKSGLAFLELFCDLGHISVIATQFD